MLLKLSLVALLFGTLCAGCAPSLMAVNPTPNAALLLPCIPPRLTDPETATDNDVALEMIELAKAYADCERRQADLAKWVRGK